MTWRTHPAYFIVAQYNNLEAWVGIEPAIEVLQTPALPLGYQANPLPLACPPKSRSLGTKEGLSGREYLFYIINISELPIKNKNKSYSILKQTKNPF